MDKDIEKIRDALISVLIIMNLRRDTSPEALENTRRLLSEVSQAPEASQLKQHLVDKLLAEFGM